MIARSFVFSIAMLLIAGLLLSGCASGAAGKVSGKVTLEGKPVTHARIQFVKKDSKNAADRDSAMGTTDDKGNFAIAVGPGTNFQLRPGSYVVLVSKFVDKTGKIPEGDPEGGLDYEQLVMSGQLKNALPAGYSEIESSDIHVEIKSANQEAIQIKLRRNGPIMGGGPMP